MAWPWGPAARLRRPAFDCAGWAFDCAGWAFDCAGWAPALAVPASMASSTSSRVMRPPGPVPAMASTSRSFSWTSLRTTGESNLARPPLPFDEPFDAAGRGCGAGSGSGSGAGAAS